MNRKRADIGQRVSNRPEPASSRGLRRRARILAAATDLFLSAGYGDTSIDAILQAAGGSKATLYSYFPTKADLFRAVVDSIVTDQEAPVLQSSNDFREVLVVFAEHRLRIVFSAKHRALIRLIIAERERFPDIARMFYERGPQRSHNELRQYFEQLIDQDLLVIRSADEACRFFHGMLMHQRFIEQLYLDTRPLSAEESRVHARHAVDRFLEAYRRPDAD